MTTFWIAAVTLAAAAAILVVRPLLRERTAGPAPLDPALALYRGQLQEIDRDVERGVLADDEANALRLEVQRRLLAADARKGPGSHAAMPARGPQWVLAAVIAAAVIGGSIATYRWIGSPGYPDQPLAARTDMLQVPHQVADLSRLADELRARLDKDPDQPEGWFLLGRTYRSLDRFAESAEAFGRAVEASGRSAEALSAYGGALVLADGGVVSGEAHAAFDEALSKDPRDGRARFYLGVAEAQIGHFQEALQIWTDLVAMSPADAPWLPQVRAQIAETAAKAGIDPKTLKPSPQAR